MCILEYYFDRYDIGCLIKCISHNMLNRQLREQVSVAKLYILCLIRTFIYSFLFGAKFNISFNFFFCFNNILWKIDTLCFKLHSFHTYNTQNNCIKICITDIILFSKNYILLSTQTGITDVVVVIIIAAESLCVCVCVCKCVSKNWLAWLYGGTNVYLSHLEKYNLALHYVIWHLKFHARLN